MNSSVFADMQNSISKCVLVFVGCRPVSEKGGDIMVNAVVTFFAELFFLVAVNFVVLGVVIGGYKILKGEGWMALEFCVGLGGFSLFLSIITSFLIGYAARDLFASVRFQIPLSCIFTFIVYGVAVCIGKRRRKKYSQKKQGLEG